MQKIAAFIVLISCSLFAGNGTHFLGISPISKSMGGTGVANPAGSVDAAYKNPAMISEQNLKAGEWEADGSFYVNKQNSSANNTSLGEKTSSAGLNYTPSVGATYQMTDKLALSLAAFPFGGAKTDFTGEATLQEVKAESTILQFGPTVGFKIFDNWSVAASPHVLYGELALNRSNAVAGTAQTKRPAHGAIGYGLHLGTAYSPMKALLLGLSFRPKTRVRYKEVVDLEAMNLLPPAAGGTSGRGDGVLDDVDSEDPAQVGFGATYNITSSFKVTSEVRYIGWSSADVFKELGWRDQYVLGLGAEYRLDKLALRAGFNYGRSVIEEASGENGFANVTISGHTVSQQSVSNLNLTGFPGIVSSHVCLGAGYDFTPNIAGDFAFVYVPEASVTRSGTGVAPTLTAGAYSYTGKVSQWSIGVGGTFKF